MKRDSTGTLRYGARLRDFRRLPLPEENLPELRHMFGGSVHHIAVFKKLFLTKHFRGEFSFAPSEDRNSNGVLDTARINFEERTGA